MTRLARFYNRKRSQLLPQWRLWSQLICIFD